MSDEIAQTHIPPKPMTRQEHEALHPEDCDCGIVEEAGEDTSNDRNIVVSDGGTGGDK